MLPSKMDQMMRCYFGGGSKLPSAPPPPPEPPTRSDSVKTVNQTPYAGKKKGRASTIMNPDNFSESIPQDQKKTLLGQ